MRYFRLNSYVSPKTVLIVCLMITGCAGRPGPELLEPVSLTDFTPKHVERLYVATTRERARPGENVFTSEKSLVPAYASFEISIPPTHRESNIEWPRGHRVDPKTDFAVVDDEVLSRAQFLKEVTQTLRREQRIGVFVHGYNFNFQESLYRLAQLKTDSSIADVGILFAWPSVASVPGYLADKEAATFSRDAMTDLLIELVERRRGAPVDVFAHSMGGWLTMEVLRQLKLMGRQDVLDNLRVVLAAPDVDVLVFTAQLSVIGKMHYPLAILVSPDDRALEVSSVLSAGVPRVGAIDVTDPIVAAAARQFGVQVIDISSLDPLDPSNHNRYAEASTIVGALTETQGGFGVGHAGAFVFDAAAKTISSPFTLAATVLRGQ